MLLISDKKQTTAEPQRRLSVQLGFKLVRHFLNPLNRLIQIGFKTRKKGKTAIGRAMSHHLRNALRGDYPAIRIDPTQAKISEGNLSQVSIHSVERKDDTIYLTWDPPRAYYKDFCSWDDELILCVYDVEAGNAAINEQQVIRQQERMELQLPSVLQGKVLHLYLMLHDRNQRIVSKSQYLGVF